MKRIKSFAKPCLLFAFDRKDICAAGRPAKVFYTFDIPPKEGLNEVLIEYQNCQGKIFIMLPSINPQKPYTLTLSKGDYLGSNARLNLLSLNKFYTNSFTNVFNAWRFDY